MKVASTILIERESKNEVLKIGVANNKTNNNGANNNGADNNGADNKSNSNAAVAQSAATNTDSVEVSQKSVALATAAKADTASNGTETQKAASEKTQTSKAQKLRGDLVSKQRELSAVVKDLNISGVHRKEIRNAVKSANRQANVSIADELRQAYKAYRAKKIGKNGFTNRLYGTVVKKLDGIVSALKGLRDKKAASAENNTVISSAINGTKETTIPVIKAKEEKASSTTVMAETEVLLSKIFTEVAKDSEILSLDGNESPDKMFAEIVDSFNSIDKIVNGFADKEEDKDSNDKDNDQSIGKFVSKLSKMFSGINNAFGNQSNGNVAHKLGMAQVNQETIDQMFGGDSATNGSVKIKSIAKESEGVKSSSFNDIRFTSSMSSGMNSSPDIYKEVQDIMAQKPEVETDKSTIAQ